MSKLVKNIIIAAGIPALLFWLHTNSNMGEIYRYGDLPLGKIILIFVGLFWFRSVLSILGITVGAVVLIVVLSAVIFAAYSFREDITQFITSLNSLNEKTEYLSNSISEGLNNSVNRKVMSYTDSFFSYSDISEEKVDINNEYRYLSNLEFNVIREMNKVRTDPAGYSSKYIEPLLDKFDGKILLRPDGSRIKTSEGKRAVRECVRELRKLKPVQPLIPSKGMSYGANDHVKDQSKTGATGHEGSDGSSSAIRVNRYGKWDKIVGENIDYGNRSSWIFK